MKSIFKGLLLLMIFYAPTALLGEKIWTNSVGNGNYMEPNNWDPVGVPTSTDSIRIEAGTILSIFNNAIVEIKHATVLGRMAVQAGSELEIENGYLWASGELFNYGTIKINNSPNYGIYQVPFISSDDRFENYGTIEISNSVGIGVFIGSNKIFKNFEGLISVDNAGGSSVTVDGTLDNYATLKTRNSAIDIALTLREGALFENSNCGKATFKNEIIVEENVDFINHSYLKITTEENLVWLSDLINHGVLEDFYDAVSFLDIDNQGVIYSKVDFPVINVDDSLKMGFTEVAIGTSFNIYTDRELTISAGSYNLILDYWVPNQNAVGHTEFFVKVNMNTCLDTIKFLTEQKVTDLNYFLAEDGTWFQSTNWSHGVIPTANDTALIYLDKSANIPISVVANAKKLFIKGNLSIADFGGIEIDLAPDGNGIELIGGSIENNGNIILRDGYQSIKMTDNSSLVNNGTIQTSASNKGIFSFNSAIQNFGEIQIDSSGCFLYQSDFENFSDLNIYLGSSGFQRGILGDKLINSGNVIINGNDNLIGIDNFHNTTTGSMVIKNFDIGIQDQGLNEGSLILDSLDVGISLNDPNNFGFSFTNGSSASLQIKNSILAISSNTPFFNLAGGIIEIENVETGIQNYYLSTNANFENYGQIKIDSFSQIAINCRGGSFKNMGGQIEIHEGNNGIRVANNGSLFSNKENGRIDLLDFSSYGILVEGAEFKNIGHSLISMDQILANAIHIDEGNDPSPILGKFTNKSTIIMGAQIDSMSVKILSGSTFTNGTCFGKITTYNPLHLEGPFYNQGYFENYANSPSMINNFLTNQGVIMDYHRQMATPNNWNAGFYYGRVQGQYSEDDTIPNLLLVAADLAQNIVIDSLWFVDSTLSQIAGKWNAQTNTLVTNNYALDQRRFYFKARIDDCNPAFKDTIFLDFENPIEKVCSNIQWVGGTNNWELNSNWDKQRKPGPCDSVLISQGTDTIFMPVDFSTEIKYLENHGTLNIGLNSNFNIHNGNTLAVRNFGQINNEGTFDISDCNGTAYHGAPGSQFKNKSTFKIKNVNQIGLQLEGLFRNELDGIINIKSVGQDVIRLKTGSYLDNLGQVFLSL